MAKERIDVLLTLKEMANSREQARKLIMAGLVKVNQEIVDKPGTKVAVDANIEVKGQLHPFVSRGGLKLVKAIETFKLDLLDKVVLDIGASTGGFTDCALQYGAKEVYAIDVGYGQLDWKLRQDDRVHVMERTNFRYLTKGDIKYSQPNFATIDVSFISLKTILNTLINLLEPTSEVVALVKPQFEAGRELVGKKGIIRDSLIHQQVLEGVIAFSHQIGFAIKDLSFSPIKGGEGNIEFLLYLTNDLTDKTTGLDYYLQAVANVVNQAHQEL